MPDALTRQEIEEALKVCERATPGPWLRIDHRVTSEHANLAQFWRESDAEFCTVARALLERTLRELLEASEDTERLDWLRLHTLHYAQFADHHNLTVATTRKTGTAKEWREAIDAARKEPTCPKK